MRKSGNCTIFRKSRYKDTMNSRTRPCKQLLPFALMILLVGGCALGPDFKEPVVVAPEAYRTRVMPTDAANDLKWWALFDDPLLYDLVTTALENNRDLKIAVSRIEQARAVLGFTRADQYPSVDVGAGAQTGNFTGGSRSPDTTSTVYLAAPLNWEIDFWGKFKRSTDAARAELMASEYGLKSVQLALISEVTVHLSSTAGFPSAVGYFPIHPRIADEKPEYYPRALRQGHHRPTGCQPGPNPERNRRRGHSFIRTVHCQNRKWPGHPARPPAGIRAHQEESARVVTAGDTGGAAVGHTGAASGHHCRPNTCSRPRQRISAWPKHCVFRPSPSPEHWVWPARTWAPSPLAAVSGP